MTSRVDFANASLVLPSSFLDQFRKSDDDFDRFLRCWKVQDCGDCIKNDANCAWCPFVSLDSRLMLSCFAFCHFPHPSVSACIASKEKTLGKVAAIPLI